MGRPETELWHVSCRQRGTSVLTSLLLHDCEVEGKVLVVPAQYAVTLCAMQLGVSLVSLVNLLFGLQTTSGPWAAS